MVSSDHETSQHRGPSPTTLHTTTVDSTSNSVTDSDDFPDDQEPIDNLPTLYYGCIIASSLQDVFGTKEYLNEFEHLLNTVVRRYERGKTSFATLHFPGSHRAHIRCDLEIPRAPSQHAVKNLTPNWRFSDYDGATSGDMAVRVRQMALKEKLSLYKGGVMVEEKLFTAEEEKLITDRRYGKFRCLPSPLRISLTYRS